jgi:hypothetical protein
VLTLRIFRYGRRRGWSRPDAALYAVFTVLDKFPGALGLLEYSWRRVRRKGPRLIEHKNQPGSVPLGARPGFPTESGG